MKRLKNSFFGLLMLPHYALAVETVSSAPSMSIFKMFSGLALVLIIMAAIAWLAKRLLPSMNHHQQTIARVISSVSVGTRERVVVVQVADRWLVVGVAPGQVNSIANLEASVLQSLEDNKINQLDNPARTLASTLSPSFADWLQKSTAKFINKSGAKNQ